MPWYNGDYPPSYKNQPEKLREKAVEIANEVLKTTGNEGEAIATGLAVAGKEPDSRYFGPGTGDEDQHAGIERQSDRGHRASGKADGAASVDDGKQQGQ